jgi:hypothetical protein
MTAAHEMMATVAARGESWGGPVVGIVAAGIFVVFSAWIVVQRIRSYRKDHHG